MLVRSPANGGVIRYRVALRRGEAHRRPGQPELVEPTCKGLEPAGVGPHHGHLDAVVAQLGDALEER